MPQSSSFASAPAMGLGSRISRPGARRRRGPYIRLGGRPSRQRRVAGFVKALKIRWLRLKQAFMLKKLRQYYRKLIRELIDSAAGAEAFQRRLAAEASFAVPGMGLSFSNNYPSRSLYSS
uniref:Uncharacterized protein n=1 Tax=Kalanchoe fedtschenkoi TaxID=63787 RepID=A0A7N0ZTU0_KALFE